MREGLGISQRQSTWLACDRPWVWKKEKEKKLLTPWLKAVLPPVVFQEVKAGGWENEANLDYTQRDPSLKQNKTRKGAI